MGSCEGFKKSSLKIAVIGAGPSGLSAGKNSIEQGHNVTIFEQNGDLGGVWHYDENVGKNEYGINIHSAMYEGLRTNAPTRMMEFPHYDFPFETRAFPTQPQMLKYLHSYADHFNVKKHIKFNHLVVRIVPIENDKWEVISKDLPNDKFSTAIFDAVFVCNGHFFKPNIPAIEGIDNFNGNIIHTHDVRKFEDFRGKNVLVIGAGTSGVEMVVLLKGIADKITLSQNKKQKPPKPDDDFNLEALSAVIKGNVRRVLSDGSVEFIDGSKEEFTTIIYGTGYKYSFPFLSVDSGIHVEKNLVQPLHKHIINIEHPTMAIIGLVVTANQFKMQDLQVRFALKFISGEKKLPSKDEMLAEIKAVNLSHSNSDSLSNTLALFAIEREYYDELSKLADIENIPTVFSNMYLHGLKKDFFTIPTEFRKYKYVLIDDENFIKELE